VGILAMCLTASMTNWYKINSRAVTSANETASL
jgi:hypothetical protein